jgi:hypothetical protein
MMKDSKTAENQMTTELIHAACARAHSLLDVSWRPRTSRPHTPARRFAIGDPQASRAQFFAILAHHGLLGADGMLAPEVSLVSIGDHFDYAGEPAEVAREGLAILRWLAEHPPEQAPILLGNHDVCRVMELAPLSDRDFAAARALAVPIKAAERQGEDVTARVQAFLERFPSLPSPGIAAKDFLGYSEAQRSLVQALLLGGRVRLALAAQLSTGQEALLTHAGLTRREQALLAPAPDTAPETAKDIAAALNQKLAEAIDRVRPHWEAGRVTEPLSLAPLHVAGTTGQEGGGLLYHRPAHPDRPGADLAWEFSASAPRRFDPRALPAGLVQVCGHTGHKKCVEELGAWVSASARQPGHGLRTLRAGGTQVSYQPGIVEGHPGEAIIHMIDAGMHAADPSAYPLLPLATGPWA